MPTRKPCKVFKYLIDTGQWEALIMHAKHCENEHCKALLVSMKLAVDTKNVQAPLSNEVRDTARDVMQKYIDILERFQCDDIHERNKLRFQLMYNIKRLDNAATIYDLNKLFTAVSLARDFITDKLHEQTRHE